MERSLQVRVSLSFFLQNQKRAAHHHHHHPWLCAYLGTLLADARFRSTEEFVIAGDFLVYKFPLWSW